MLLLAAAAAIRILSCDQQPSLCVPSLSTFKCEFAGKTWEPRLDEHMIYVCDGKSMPKDWTARIMICFKDQNKQPYGGCAVEDIKEGKR